MTSSVQLDIFLILLILFTSFIFLFVFIILGYYLLRRNKYLKKNYTALLINYDQIIEMKIPIKQKREEKFINHFFKPIQTQTYHSNYETNNDYYQSILSTNESSYYPVRETTFQGNMKSHSQSIINLEKNDEIYHV